VHREWSALFASTADLGAAAAKSPFVRISPVLRRGSEVPLLTSTTETQIFPSLLFGTKFQLALRPPQLGFACRRGERPFGPSRIRPCGLTAASHPGPRLARLASTSLLGRSAGLRSGLFCGAKRSRRSIRLPRPVGPFACSGRANLPSKHTHMSVEAYPPDGPQNQPASRIAKLCDEHARQSAVQTSTKVDPFYAAIWSLFTLRLTPWEI